MANPRTVALAILVKQLVESQKKPVAEVIQIHTRERRALFPDLSLLQEEIKNAAVDAALKLEDLPLESFKGKDGRDGLDGKDGINGESGKDGRDGLDGKQGKNGIDGRDGKDFEIDQDVEALIRRSAQESAIQFKDLSEEERDSLRGISGRDGRDGRDGIDGKDFVFEDHVEYFRSLKPTFTELTPEEKATLRLAFSDLTEENKEELRGLKGSRGQRGRPGERGLPGAQGARGPIGPMGSQGTPAPEIFSARAETGPEGGVRFAFSLSNGTELLTNEIKFNFKGAGPC